MDFDFEFDFNSIPVPFRMQPGLQRAVRVGLHRLRFSSPLHKEKAQVFRARQSRFQVPGFDPVHALRAIAEQAQPGLGFRAVDTADAPLELRFEEDMAVIDGATGKLLWLAICTPSHWAPEEKIGLDFSELHGPVPDNDLLLQAHTHLLSLVTSGGCWTRSVFTITPSARYDQHPARHTREPWPDACDMRPADFAARCFLRAEQQGFFPVADERGKPMGQAVFSIRVLLHPLTEAVKSAAQARRVHGALGSMSDAVLAYKNLSDAKAPLMAWLEGMGAASSAASRQN
jgi:hypothetical protein